MFQVCLFCGNYARLYIAEGACWVMASYTLKLDSFYCKDLIVALSMKKSRDCWVSGSRKQHHLNVHHVRTSQAGFNVAVTTVELLPPSVAVIVGKIPLHLVLVFHHWLKIAFQNQCPGCIRWSILAIGCQATVGKTERRIFDICTRYITIYSIPLDYCKPYL